MVLEICHEEITPLEEPKIRVGEGLKAMKHWSGINAEVVQIFSFSRGVLFLMANFPKGQNLFYSRNKGECDFEVENVSSNNPPWRNPILPW